MFVCLCLGVSDHEIRQLVREGARSAAEVMQCSGAGTRCGRCVAEIEGMVGDRAGIEKSALHRLPVYPPKSNAA